MLRSGWSASHGIGGWNRAEYAPRRHYMPVARSPRAPSSTPLAIPLTPAMRPMDHSSRTAASPISTPPASPDAQLLMRMERVMGIEPTLAAWEAAVLPLNYTRAEDDECTGARAARSSARRRPEPAAPARANHFATRIFLTQPPPLLDSTFTQPSCSSPM